MAVRKIAISVPEHVLAQVDAAAAERGENRSRFITQVLVLLAQARTDREISRRVNAVFAEPRSAGSSSGRQRLKWAARRVDRRCDAGEHALERGAELDRAASVAVARWAPQSNALRQGSAYLE